MTIGDRVKLHIDTGHRLALDLPDGVGVIQAIEHDANSLSLLVHFDTMAVYLTAIAPEEVEIVSAAPCRRAVAPSQ